MASVDRIQGLSGSIAIKAPCRLATTAAITLSGEQIIDGSAAVEDDRVLVKDQSSSIDNGIYVVSTGSWTRSADTDGNNDLKNGTLVYVVAGASNGGCLFRFSGTDPIVVGTSAITAALSFATADTVTVADAASDTTCWLALVSSQTGDLAVLTDGGLTYNATTNAFSAAGGVTTAGALVSTLATGTAPLTIASTTKVDNLYVARAALADVATTAATVTVADAASDTTCWLALVSSQTGDLAVLTDGGLTYNASTNLLSVSDLSASGYIASANVYSAEISVQGKLYFYFYDFDTYIYESSSNVLDFYVGGSMRLRLNSSGATASQYTSTVATGTAPLVVSSTTKVSNFNADLLDDQSGAYYLSRANHTGTQTLATISDAGTIASQAANNVSITGGAISGTSMTLQGSTVAELPAAGSIGHIAYVTDALAPAFLVAVVGGGTVKCPVFDDGTNWVAY